MLGSKLGFSEELIKYIFFGIFLFSMLNGFWEAIQGLNQVKPHCLINLGNILPIIVVIFLLEMKQAVKSKRSSKVFCKKLASKMYVDMVKEQVFFSC